MIWNLGPPGVNSHRYRGHFSHSPWRHPLPLRDFGVGRNGSLAGGARGSRPALGPNLIAARAPLLPSGIAAEAAPTGQCRTSIAAEAGYQTVQSRGGLCHAARSEKSTCRASYGNTNSPSGVFSTIPALSSARKSACTPLTSRAQHGKRDRSPPRGPRPAWQRADPSAWRSAFRRAGKASRS